MGRLGSERGHSNRFGQNSKRRRYRAFTLVELLVVLAIIGLLAALILPSLSRAKTQGFSTICRNHLRQIGFAAQMYLADYRHYPTFWGRVKYLTAQSRSVLLSVIGVVLREDMR